MVEPGGGQIQLNLDGKPYKVLDTNGDKAVAVEDIAVPDGEHELEVVTIKGSSRAFGVVMERDQPGVVLDALGVQGARIRFLDKQDDQHWAQQLQWRKPSLLIFHFGANESGDGFAYPMDQYHASMKAVLEQARRAVPEAGCLILGAMDRAEKKGADLHSMAVIPAIVKEQRAVAKAVGCAFFNTYQAMGGPGSMAGWVGRGLGQADLTHPTGSGSEVLASWIFRALMAGYAQYIARP
jgi:lysophospholipase L1-like esterase